MKDRSSASLRCPAWVPEMLTLTFKFTVKMKTQGENFVLENEEIFESTSTRTNFVVRETLF